MKSSIWVRNYTEKQNRGSDSKSWGKVCMVILVELEGGFCREISKRGVCVCVCSAPASSNQIMEGGLCTEISVVCVCLCVFSTNLL